MPDTVAEIFDLCADHYATERERKPYFIAQLRIAMSMFAAELRGVVLDIGCAAGAEISMLRSLDFQVIGADLSEKMLGFARNRFLGDNRVAFVLANAEHLPMSSASVDHVLCLGMFEFLSDYSPALKEIWRVLRPGGVVVIAVPSRVSLYNLSHLLARAVASPLWRMIKQTRSSGAGQGQPFKRNLCIPWRMRMLLAKHGLTVEREAFSNYFVYPLDRFPALDERVADLLEPLASIPIVRLGASVFLISARKS